VGDQLGDTVGAVEQAVVTVAVQVNERGFRHISAQPISLGLLLLSSGQLGRPSILEYRFDPIVGQWSAVVKAVCCPCDTRAGYASSSGKEIN
jgi:hypothetical protein